MKALAGIGEEGDAGVVVDRTEDTVADGTGAGEAGTGEGSDARTIAAFRSQETSM
jgi:hypothetical protein